MIRMSHHRVKLLILVNDPYDWMFALKIQRMIGAMPKKPQHLWYEKHCHQSE